MARSEPVGHCGGDIKETLDSEGPTVMDQFEEDPTAAICRKMRVDEDSATIVYRFASFSYS